MTNASARRRRPALVIIGVVLIGGLLAGAAYGFSYLFLREEAPPPVGAASASAEPSVTPSEPDEVSTAPVASSAASASTWSVDASVGSFDDFSSSFVGYRVEEELANIGAATAVGRTPDVTGSLVLEGETLASVEISANLATLESDDDRRDGQLQRQAIETDTFPIATFVLSEPIDLPDGALDGETVTVAATGELTLHGVTRSVEVPITATLADGVITVTGSIQVAFADYDIEKPTSFLVLSVADVGVMEFQLHFSLG